MILFKFIVRVQQAKECISLSASVPPLLGRNYFVVSIHG